MNVLMFGWEFPPHNSGGLGTACEGIVDGLIDEGVDVTFVLPRKAEYERKDINFRFTDEPEIKNIQFKFIESDINSPYLPSSKVVTKNGFYCIDPKLGYDLYEKVLHYAKEAERIAKNTMCDVIHAHDWLAFKAGVEAKKTTGKPLVAHIHATEYDRAGGNEGNEFIHAVEQEGFDEADLIIAVSEFTKSIVCEKYHIDPNKVVVVHNGVDTSKFTRVRTITSETLSELKETGTKVVLSLGRITLMKNPDVFIHAAKKVSEFIKEKVIFIMAGDGDAKERSMELAEQLGIADRVLFPGFVRGRERDEMYELADLFVMPSISEPFGITALESLIKETPVLISKTSGVSEALSHALKVDFWDVDEMANKIVALLRHDSMQEEITKNGKYEAEMMTWNKAAKEIVKAYEVVV